MIHEEIFFVPLHHGTANFRYRSRFYHQFFPPDGMIDWFEVVNMTEENNPGTTIADKLYYKHHLSDYEVWTQKEHATDWVLLPENIGEYLSIDETQLCEEVYTILSNYFINRATNASAESLNSKMKGFRAQLHGIADIPNTEVMVFYFEKLQKSCKFLE